MIYTRTVYLAAALTLIGRSSQAQTRALEPQLLSSSCTYIDNAERQPACIALVYLAGVKRIGEMPDPSSDLRKPASEQELVGTVAQLLLRYRSMIRVRAEECRAVKQVSRGGDSTMAKFVGQFCRALEAQAGIDSMQIEALLRATSGTPDVRSVAQKAEELASRQEQAEATSQLFILSAVALANAMLEKGSDQLRLSLSEADRIVLEREASRLAASLPKSVYQQASSLFADFLKRGWKTR